MNRSLFEWKSCEKCTFGYPSSGKTRLSLDSFAVNLSADGGPFLLLGNVTGLEQRRTDTEEFNR